MTRSRRFTRARYEESAHLQTVHRETKALWPRRWLLVGERVVPVSLWVRSLSKHQHTMDTLVKTLRGRVAVLETTLARQERVALKTQAYIDGTKARLEAAALAGLTVAEHIEREHAGAVALWKRPALGPDGYVLPIGSLDS
jgi:hypothetical protein